MAWLKLIVVAWLPGAIVFRLPFASRDRRASLQAEERAFWAVVISALVSLSIVIALAAAHRYSFRRLAIADIAIAAILALLARGRLRFGPAARRVGPIALVPAALVVLGVWRFFPPSEYIIGGKDPGVYLNEGIQIAQRGALVVHDRTVTDVPPFARDLFFPSFQNPDYYSLRFMGFFLQSPDTGAVVGQFPHLFPASIAIGYALDGLTGARCAVGVWAILGLLAVYFTGARIFGRPAAGAGAALLALNLVEVWFSRYPNAEVVMQALLFAALLANARAHVDGDGFFAPVSGALLGLLLFLRIDATLAVAAVIAGLAIGVAAGQRPRWTFWPPLAIGAMLYAWYLGGPMRGYAALPIVFLTHFRWWQYAAIAAGVAGIVACVVLAARSSRTSALVRSWLPAAFAVVMVVAAVYALAFRHPVGKLTDYDAYALRTYASFYVTYAAIVAALVGYVLVGRGLFWRDPALLITITAFSLFFFYKIHIVPDHFWMARRFLPVILPGTLLLVGAAALTAARGRWLSTRLIRAPVGIVLLVALGVVFARNARPVVNYIEYEGIIPRLEQLANAVGPADLLIVEARDSSDVHVLALPLAYIYARQALVLASPVPDKTTFAAFLNRAMGRHYTRVLFMGGGGTDLLSSRWSVAPIAGDRFQVPEYDSPYNAYPRGVRHKEFEYTIYAFGPPVTDTGAFALDVGINDDLNVLRFNAKERTEGRTVRWTRGRSFVILNRVHASDREIAFTISSGGRPPTAAPADVTVRSGDRVLGTFRVQGGFADYAVPIPSEVAAAWAATGEPVRISIETPTWNPRKLLGASDDRDLGVMVDRVAVR